MPLTASQIDALDRGDLNYLTAVAKAIQLGSLLSSLGDGVLPDLSISEDEIDDGAVAAAKLKADAIALFDAAGSAAAAAAASDPAGSAAAAQAASLPVGGTAVKADKLTLTGAEVFEFTGSNGAGACALVGAAVGDKVLFLTPRAFVSLGTRASFEAVITVGDQIEQTDVGNLSADTFDVLLLRA